MMPAPVRLDSISSENLDFGGSTTITIVPYYLDPPGTANHYYRFVEYDNGTQVQAVFVQNDDLSHGLKITEPLLNSDGKIKRGDAVMVDLQCIDSAVYKYWFSLGQSSTGNSQSAAPANPVSNFTGGCLGYFSAYSVSSQSLTVR